LLPYGRPPAGGPNSAYTPARKSHAEPGPLRTQAMCLRRNSQRQMRVPQLFSSAAEPKRASGAACFFGQVFKPAGQRAECIASRQRDLPGGWQRLTVRGADRGVATPEASCRGTMASARSRSRAFSQRDECVGAAMEAVRPAVASGQTTALARVGPRKAAARGCGGPWLRACWGVWGPVSLDGPRSAK
jgi:hypothetical protein